MENINKLLCASLGHKYLKPWVRTQRARSKHEKKFYLYAIIGREFMCLRCLHRKWKTHKVLDVSKLKI